MSRTISTIVDNSDTREVKIQGKRKNEEGKRENSKADLLSPHGFTLIPGKSLIKGDRFAHSPCSALRCRNRCKALI